MLNSRLDWEDLEVLDLYSGSGAMAFEFLSRGVKAAIALDNNNNCVRFISDMKEKWKVEKTCRRNPRKNLTTKRRPIQDRPIVPNQRAK